MRTFLILFLICGLFDCSIIRLKYHKATSRIYSGSGLIALEVDKFDTDESIYVTYSSVDGNIGNYVRYEFSDTFPDEEHTPINRKDPYSSAETEVEHNESNGYGGYRVYYTYDYDYYYEFIKPENKSYLIMDYYVGNADYIIVDNTLWGRWKTLIIIISVVASIIVLGVGIFLLIRYRKKISCPDFSCLCDCDCPCPWKRNYSYNITTNTYNQPSEKKDLLIDTAPDVTPAITNTELKQMEVKEPVPQADYGEKPYYEQEEQQNNNNYNSNEPPVYPNPNEVNPPQPAYDPNIQPPNNIYQQPEPGYNGYEQNPPQNNEGYNSGNFTGGGGIYQ